MKLLKLRIEYLIRFRNCLLIPACPESLSQWQIARRPAQGDEAVIIGEIYVHPFSETEEIEGISWFRLPERTVSWIKKCLRARVYVNMIFMTRTAVRAFTIKDIKYLDRIQFKGQYLIREKSVPKLPFSTKYLPLKKRRFKR